MAIIYLAIRRFVEKRFSSRSFVSEVQEEVGKIITELNQTTDRNVQVIEHHLEELKKVSGRAENLVKNASREVSLQEDRIHKYRKLQGSANPRAASALQPAQQQPAQQAQQQPAQPAQQQAAQPAQQQAAQPQPAGLPDQIITGASPSFAAQDTLHFQATDSHPQTGHMNREQKKTLARELYAKGADLPEIAETTGLSLAEVELIIALIRR